MNGDLLAAALTADLRDVISKVDGERELFTVSIVLDRN